MPRYVMPVTIILLGLTASHPCVAGDEQESADVVELNGFKALVPPSGHQSLTAFLRKVRLSSGEQWAVDLYGDHLIGFGVENQSIAPDQPNNSPIELSVHDAKTILASAVNLEGVSQAAGAHLEGATVVIDPAQGLARQAFSARTRVHPHLSAMFKNFMMRKTRMHGPSLAQHKSPDGSAARKSHDK